MRAAGGALIGQLGTHVASIFDSADLTDAIDLGLELLDQSDDHDGPRDIPDVGLAICMGGAVDDTATSKSVLNLTVDRCVLLVSLARAGELLLDVEAHQVISDRYTFGRTLSRPDSSIHGFSVVRAREPMEAPSGPVPDGLVHEIISSVLAGDFDATEKRLAIALAEGKDPAAAERVRALIHLLQGDVSKAMRVLAASRAKDTGGNRHQAARASLALALVLLQAGDAGQAIRAALGALAVARATHDSKGESAALRTLSACYRFLGRDGDAVAIQKTSS
jgi:tetratricopeptide (TPR) repeat protein